MSDPDTRSSGVSRPHQDRSNGLSCDRIIFLWCEMPFSVLIDISTVTTCISGLSHEQNLRKMRYLSFVQLAEDKKEIEYAVIQREMQLEEAEIEDFIIDGT